MNERNKTQEIVRTMSRLQVGKQGISVTLPRTVSGIFATGGVFTIILGVAVIPNPTAIGIGLALALLGATIYLATGR